MLSLAAKTIQEYRKLDYPMRTHKNHADAKAFIFRLA